MINESIDSLETKLGKRKQFLFDNDLEKLQKEFIAKKEKCNSKIIKLENKKSENEANFKNLIIPTGEIKQKKGKKKVKDIITLNLPPLNQEKEVSNKNYPESSSLFSINYNKLEEKNKNINQIPIDINKTTGLPDTFKIEQIEKETKIEEDKTINAIKEMDIEEVNNEDIKEEQFKSKEYEEINNENQKKIEQMSKEEILEAQKEIFASIPSDLLEKFKSNFFTQQIKKSLHEKESNKSKEIKLEENKNKENNIIMNQNKHNINLNFKKILNNKTNDSQFVSNNNEEIILFSYEGNMKKENKEKYLINNPELKETIDYRFLTFNELELNNKYFSLDEINALLSSSNNLQISIGLRIILNLLKNKYHLTLDIFINQLESLFNKLYYLAYSTNLNIKSQTLQCISLLYHDFFYEDYKIYKFNSMLLGMYPSIIYFNFNNMSKNLQKQKKLCIKSIQENGYENIIEYINILRNGGINEEINNSLLSLIFFTIYICEQIPCKLSKIFEINFDFLSKKQCLIKLMAVLCNYEDFGKNIKFFDKLMKNKNFFKFLIELRGLGNSSSILIEKNEYKKSIKRKIYDLNYLLLFNNNNSIKYDIDSKEKDFLLLSKILQLKLFYCLNPENNNENDNYLSLVNSDTELNFWTDKFREGIKILEENEIGINYIELISIYKYISTFLYFWHKTFKYPQLISYKKISIDLNDILNLFPLFNKILTKTLNDIIFNNQQISFDKNDTMRNLYPFSILLEMNLNYLKCFIKNYDEKTNINGLSLYFIKLSELINKGDEYYYRKYTKILRALLSKKLSFSKIQNINDYFDYKEIEEDLNFYLYSNEDLRKSTFYKRLFSLINNNERLNNLNLMISQDNNNASNDKIFDSKYFPFDSNFIYQILSNEKSKVSIKINYLLILTLLYEKENIQKIISNTSTFNIITPFEIVIKFILTINLSEFNTNKKLFNLFKIFVRYNIIQEKFENINMSLTDNNKIIMGNFFELYDSNYFVDENKILIEIIPLLFIFLHNNRKNENSKLLEPFRYKKTIEGVVYDNFSFISKYKNFFDINEDEKNNIIKYLMENISIMFTSFYQTLILCYLNYRNNLKEEGNNNIDDNNLITEYAQRLCDKFGVKKEDYKNYVENKETLIGLIKNEITKSRKNKSK